MGTRNIHLCLFGVTSIVQAHSVYGQVVSWKRWKNLAFGPPPGQESAHEITPQYHVDHVQTSVAADSVVRTFPTVAVT